ncbi:MAG: amidase, partial [Proteobacteria bacterium]|nr:amidase [Pseudomonadota bacterium]
MTLLDQSARQLAAGIRSREVSPLEVVDAHIARIEQVNGAINALAVDRFAAARAEAREAGELIARSDPRELPPLLGVPFTVKEFLAVSGMPQTGGLVRRRHHIASEDATTVARVRRAGAICLGVTNAAEAGLWSETTNRVYGRTRNPWDLRRTSGGSSGGSGALVAAGGVPFDLGADVGGSIRIP